jgi:hypothetical protein
MKYFKLNQTVYHYEYGKGVVIDVINNVENFPILVIFEDGKESFTEDGRNLIGDPIVLSQTPIPEIVNVPLEEEYVPFTFEDRELLRGQWVRGKLSKEEFMIIYIGHLKVEVNGNYYTYQHLFEVFEFIDGKPCGKLG